MSLTVEDTRYISLNTQHGVSHPTSGNYVTSYLSNINFHFRGLLKEEDDILYSHIDIVNAQIPVSFYNINYASNTLKYTINNGSILTLTVDRSNYNLNSLMVELKSKFLSAGYTMVITFFKPTGKFTFSSSQPFSFLSMDSTILEILGFDSVSNYVSTNNVLVGEHPCNLLGIKKLKFCSSALATNSISSYGSGSDSLFGIIPVNATPFGMIQYTNTSGRRSLLKNKVIDTIDIQVKDENNRYINFNNTEWSITLAITTTRRVKDTQNDNSFSDMIKPILQLLKPPEQNTDNTDTTINDINQPAVGIDKSLFTNETDLDFFMYQHGIDI